MIEYRQQTLFNYHDDSRRYYIQYRIDGGKWKFAFGNLTREEITALLANPKAIEAQRKVYRITGICMIVFMIIAILILILT